MYIISANPWQTPYHSPNREAYANEDESGLHIRDIFEFV